MVQQPCVTERGDLGRDIGAPAASHIYCKNEGTGMHYNYLIMLLRGMHSYMYMYVYMYTRVCACVHLATHCTF